MAQIFLTSPSKWNPAFPGSGSGTYLNATYWDAQRRETVSHLIHHRQVDEYTRATLHALDHTTWPSLFNPAINGYGKIEDLFQISPQTTQGAFVQGEWYQVDMEVNNQRDFVASSNRTNLQKEFHAYSSAEYGTNPLATRFTIWKLDDAGKKAEQVWWHAPGQWTIFPPSAAGKALHTDRDGPTARIAGIDEMGRQTAPYLVSTTGVEGGANYMTKRSYSSTVRTQNAPRNRVVTWEGASRGHSFCLWNVRGNENACHWNATHRIIQDPNVLDGDGLDYVPSNVACRNRYDDVQLGSGTGGVFAGFNIPGDHETFLDNWGKPWERTADANTQLFSSSRNFWVEQTTGYHAYIGYPIIRDMTPNISRGQAPANYTGDGTLDGEFGSNVLFRLAFFNLETISDTNLFPVCSPNAWYSVRCPRLDSEF